MTSFEQRVWHAAEKIPKGKVATYAAIARAIGSPRSARAVGNALNKNPRPFFEKGVPVRSLARRRASGKYTPCHRVIKSDGTVGGFAFGQKKKKDLLQKEGIIIKGKKVLLRHILFRI